MRRPSLPRTSPSAASQVERAYASIKTGIVTGRYAAGTALSEPGLADEHGMSRTPIREGLSRLWQEQYLDRIPGRGYFVARITVQTITDTFEVRRLLEGAASARAAELATPIEIQQLRTLARVRLAPADYRDAEAGNTRFHLAIASAARNRLAVELIERCLAQVDRFLSLGMAPAPLQEAAFEAHCAIVEAIAARDQSAARRLMEEHLDRGSEGMKEALLRGGLPIGV